MGYRIGSFNCLNFSGGNVSKSRKDVQTIANIIRNEQFDIVALQEVKNQEALNMILKQLGPQWAGEADNDFRVSDYAFIWKKRRVNLAKYESFQLSRTNSPIIYSQYKVDKESNYMRLSRDPYYARFVPVGGAAPFIEIRILNAHIRFSKGSGCEEVLVGVVSLRKQEFEILTKNIYVNVADKCYGNNRPAYTILLGDFNLNHPSSGAGSPYLVDEIEINDNDKSKLIVTKQTDLTTLKKIQSDDNQSECRFANNYDHFTYDAIRFKDVSVQCESINAVQKYCNGDFKKYNDTVSDHIPIVMNLNIRR